MMGGYTKREIISAAVEALRPLALTGGGYVRQLEARGLDKGPADLSGDVLGLPAILVSFSSSNYSPGQYMHVRESVGFEVVVVFAAGSGHDPEKLLGEVRGLLAGTTLGLDVGLVTPVRESPLQAGSHRVAYGALYSVTQQVPVG